MNATMEKVMHAQYGFITSEDKELLSVDHPKLQVLVRTGMNRYVCGLANLDEVFEQIESKGDYVRDVGLTETNYNRILDNLTPYNFSGIRQVHPD